MKEINSKKLNNNNGNKRLSPGFLMESSRMDESGNFPEIALKSILSGIDNTIGIQHDRGDRWGRQKDFLMDLISEFFHDIRSPFISIIGFAELFRYKSGADSQIQEYSTEILNEGKSALKRIEGIEDLFTAYFSSHIQKKEKVIVPQVIDWVLSVLEKKIARKKLGIVKRIDRSLKSREVNLDIHKSKMLLFELVCRLVLEANNKESLIVEATSEERKVIFSMSIDPVTGRDMDKEPVEFTPAFIMNTAKIFRIPGPGFRLIIDIDNN